MKTPSKVLFLARWYPDRYDPMMGLFIQRHAEAAAEFTDVAVLYLRAAPDRSFGIQIEQKEIRGVYTLIAYYGTRGNFPPFISKLLASILFVFSFFKGYNVLRGSWGQPDLVHLNVLTRLGIFALWLQKMNDIPYVITEHWSRYLPITGTYSGFFRKMLTKYVVSNAKAVSTVSENLADAMKEHGLLNRNYLVLPNVVDTDSYKPLSPVKESGIKRFIHISCFEDRSKNISGLLHVIGKLSNSRTDFECIMVGDGIDFVRMKALADVLGLKEPQLRFTGLLENEKLIEAYQSSDFMVMFSNYENMPVVISESFSCGIPVVATSVGGIPEYVSDVNGRLVAAGDEIALSEAISYMLNHSDDFDRVKIRQEAIATFGRSAVADKLKELYCC